MRSDKDVLEAIWSFCDDVERLRSKEIERPTDDQVEMATMIKEIINKK